MSANLLSAETSPYLLQHAHNPVHWRPWGAAALEEAQRLDKPILLSIGYAACHWCHVMAHESFENDETAALMNAQFVCVKVDREERPDIDHIYMSALHALGQQGGWPLTMFLAPDGRPYFGGTYWPPEPRWGRPAFRQILEGAARVFRENRKGVAENGAALTEHFAQMSAAAPGGAIAPQTLTAAAHAVLGQMDPVYGGMGDAPKFPNAPIFRFLWQDYARTEDARAREAVRNLLNALCEGGIYDHLGGGFARYATDAQWHVPHFEKMLYDNAQILELLAFAHADQPSPLYAERARETVAWLLREMAGPRDAQGDAAFAAAQDADQEGEEGLFYTWRAEEIEQALGAQAQAFMQAYDVRPRGNWENRNVLRRLGPHGAPPEEAALARSRATLFALREKREKPARDDKILADWNGLMIRALARSAIAFAEPAWLQAAQAAYRFVMANVRDGRGHLAHAWRGRVSAAGQLDDYAAMTLAALALFEASGDTACLDDAIILAATARAKFGDADGSYFQTSFDAADVPGARPRHARDNATPSGAGMMAQAFARLWLLTGEATWRDQAEALVSAFSGAGPALVQSPTLLGAVDMLERGATAVVAGDAGAQPLLALARAAPDPALAVLHAREGEVFADDNPAHGRAPIGGKAAVYICRNMTCGLPIADAAELANALSLTASRV
ncbi:MAG: thioredoxin domain-containing protein [Hyphomicrobiales bacterium]|nr:thioredoxin domain-containing protein [Hyphomicrobiales bacterium]